MKDQIKQTAYFSVQAWMVTNLKLRTVERDVYAVIYGYSQDGESDFHGSLDYIAQLTGYTRNSICTALKSLTEKELILKTEKTINNIKYCRYRTNPLYSIQATCTVNEESVQATCMNNKQIVSKDTININNKKDNNVEWFQSNYHSICVSLPKIRAITDKRKKAIAKIMKSYSKEEILEVFTLAESSDFLKGNNDRGWKADIDFILREDKFARILEGGYSSKKQSKKRFQNEGISIPYTKEDRIRDEEFRKEMRANGESTIF